MTIRAALASDSDAIWAILEPVIRAGETFALPREMRREEALSYWFAPTHEVFVAVEGNKAVGTYFLRQSLWRRRPRGQRRLHHCGRIIW